MSDYLMQEIEEEIKRLQYAKDLQECFDANNLKSRPTPAQHEIFKQAAQKAKYFYVLGGNQTVLQGSLISMADGSTRVIEAIRPGDEVLCFDTKLKQVVVTKVAQVHDHGILPFFRYSCGNNRYIEATENHEMVTLVKDTFEKVQMINLPQLLDVTTDSPFVPRKIIKKKYIGKLQGYDLTVLHPDHNFICNGFVSGNSGKTTWNIRELVWFLRNEHPYLEWPTDHRCNNKLCLNENIISKGDETSPTYFCSECGNSWKSWGENPVINVILCGENRMNLTQNLWEPRIKPLLPDGHLWEPKKFGHHVGWVEHKTKGHKIFFFPHGHGVEQARKAVQGFSIHAVFMDELAGATVIEELQRRLDSMYGYFRAAFTMKTLDPDVLRLISSQVKSGAAKQFKLSKLDNPRYSGMKDVILAQLAGLTEAQKNAVLYGEVADGDDRVFSYNEDFIKIDKLPDTYNPHVWRHVELVDPAQQSKAGYLIFAQDPQTFLWYLVKAEYITGMQDPLDLVDECSKRSKNFNIILRGSDNMAWFVSTARKQRNIKYVTPPNKQAKDGKIFLIKKAQVFLSEGRLRIPEYFEDFWIELGSYRWKEGAEKKIINSHKYHLLDCFIYFVDLLPKNEAEAPLPSTWMQEIREYNQKSSGSKNNQKKFLKSKKRSYKIVGVNDMKKFTAQANKFRRK